MENSNSQAKDNIIGNLMRQSDRLWMNPSLGKQNKKKCDTTEI